MGRAGFMYLVAIIDWVQGISQAGSFPINDG